jgi:hypothetical protein
VAAKGSLTGSISVSPTVTTTYTFEAVTTGGSTADDGDFLPAPSAITPNISSRRGQITVIVGTNSLSVKPTTTCGTATPKFSMCEISLAYGGSYVNPQEDILVGGSFTAQSTAVKYVGGFYYGGTPTAVSIFTSGGSEYMVGDVVHLTGKSNDVNITVNTVSSGAISTFPLSVRGSSGGWFANFSGCGICGIYSAAGESGTGAACTNSTNATADAQTMLGALTIAPGKNTLLAPGTGGHRSVHRGKNNSADSTGSSGTQMTGTVTSFAGTTLVINETSTGGSGTHAGWSLTTASGGRQTIPISPDSVSCHPHHGRALLSPRDQRLGGNRHQPGRPRLHEVGPSESLQRLPQQRFPIAPWTRATAPKRSRRATAEVERSPGRLRGSATDRVERM